MRQWPASAFLLAPKPGEPARVRDGSIEVTFAPATCLPEALRGEWEALEQEAAEPNSFAEWWFTAASLRFLAREGVRLASVRSEGRLIGTILLHVVEDYGRAPIPHVENWVHCNHFLGAPLVRRGEEANFWEGLLRALDGASWAPGFLHLTRIAEEGPVHRGLRSAAQALGRSCDVVHRRSRALFETDLAPQDYLARNLSAKRRSELGRRRKRLGERGRVEVRGFGDGEDLAAWCDEFLALERAGWKGEAGSALACSPARADFFREALDLAHGAGRLHFLRLDLDGRAVAMLTAFLAPPGAFGFKSAFDEAYARFSPGTLLQIDNLDMLNRADIAWTDSCSTDEHAMINGLWSERRSIVRLTVRLAGARRIIPFAAARALDRGAEALRPFHRIAGEKRR